MEFTGPNHVLHKSQTCNLKSGGMTFQSPRHSAKWGTLPCRVGTSFLKCLFLLSIYVAASARISGYRSRGEIGNGSAHHYP